MTASCFCFIVDSALKEKQESRGKRIWKMALFLQHCSRREYRIRKQKGGERCYHAPFVSLRDFDQLPTLIYSSFPFPISLFLPLFLFPAFPLLQFQEACFADAQDLVPILY